MDEFWCADITYIPMSRSFADLAAVMDWKTRALVSWKLYNMLEVAFCVEAFEEAVKEAGKASESFNTDEGSLFSSDVWIKTVEKAGVRVSMDGKKQWIDNVFIERFLRSGKYEALYLRAPQTVHELEVFVRPRPSTALSSGESLFGVQIPVPRFRLAGRHIQELVKTFRTSGLPKAAFFRQNRIAPSCLSRYLKKSPPPDPPHNPRPLRFLEVEIPAPPLDALAYQIVFPSRLRLELPRPFQSYELSALVWIV